MALVCLIFGLLFPQLASAYPEFIGYKYSSCVTCHYNGHGNGPLNDYGRAVFASEIAGRWMAGSKNEEQLGASSGIFGSPDALPWWFRPGVKARNLLYMTNPGRPNSDSRNILMQADANAAVLFDQEQNKIFVLSIGYVPKPYRLRNSSGAAIDEWISREHYFRWHVSEPLWLYVGMMDKVYGIRHVNHTAYSRSRVGIAQNDQTHGIVAHYVKPEWELTGHLFAGNMSQDANLRQVGLSAMFEYEIKSAWRIGASALNSSNDFVKNQRFGLHSRYGFGYGASTLFEVGMINNSPEIGTSTSGYYIFSEAMQKIARGYHIFFNGQAYKADMTSGNTDILKFGIGTLMFPIYRTETRIEIENTRPIENGPNIPRESWAVLLQLHLAL